MSSKQSARLLNQINSDMLQGTALSAILPLLELEKASLISEKNYKDNKIVRFEIPASPFSDMLRGRVNPDPGSHLLKENLGINIYDMLIDCYGMPLAIFPLDRGVKFKNFNALPYWDLTILSLPSAAFYSCGAQRKEAITELWQERSASRLEALERYSSELQVDIVTAYKPTNPGSFKYSSLPYISTLDLCFLVNALAEADSGAEKLMSVLDPSSVNQSFFPAQEQGRFIMPFAPTVYRPVMGFDYGFYNEIIKTAHQLCRHNESLKIMDIACGSGMIPAIISEIARHYGTSVEIFAYDLNPIAAAQTAYFLKNVLGGNANVCQASSPDQALMKMEASQERFDLITINAPMPLKFSGKPKTLIDLHDCHSDAGSFHNNLKNLANSLAVEGQILLWSSSLINCSIKGLSKQRLNSFGCTSSTYKFVHK